MEENKNEIPEANSMFCSDCGAKISKNAISCPKCGAPTKVRTAPSGDNKFLITILLCWFLGVFGVHRFYTGHTTIGVLQLITLGGCGIWTLIDLIILITGNYKDADGNLIKA